MFPFPTWSGSGYVRKSNLGHFSWLLKARLYRLGNWGSFLFNVEAFGEKHHLIKKGMNALYISFPLPIVTRKELCPYLRTAQVIPWGNFLGEMLSHKTSGGLPWLQAEITHYNNAEPSLYWQALSCIGILLACN